MAKKKRDIKVSFVDEPASEGVTGSGVYIETPNHKILLDYGLAQSNDKYEDFLVNRRKPKEFKVKECWETLHGLAFECELVEQNNNLKLEVI